MSDKAPIGVFDSGVGGLSVWKEIAILLPKESIIYYADSVHCPYGNKTQQEIINLSEKIVNFFIKNKVKLIVVACNTATAAAIAYLRKKYSISFVGMEPAVKPAALQTKTGVVGILATEGTFKGTLFNDTKLRYANGVEVLEQDGKGFVELVESGNVTNDKSISIVKASLEPLLEKGIDQLVLGCTHYPFLKEDIKIVAGKHSLEIIDPAPAVAKQVQRILKQENKLNLEKEVHYTFYSSTKQMNVLKQMVKKLLKSNNFTFEYKVL